MLADKEKPSPTQLVVSAEYVNLTYSLSSSVFHSTIYEPTVIIPVQGSV